MNEEIKSKKESLPEQLIEAKSLYDDCKFDEALLLVDDLDTFIRGESTLSTWIINEKQSSGEAE